MLENIPPRFRELLEKEAIPSGNAAYRLVPFMRCRAAADETGISCRKAELFALELGICPSRYERNMGTLGLDGQRKLLESRVAVVGLGGLGGLIAEMLARAGVGRLTLIDGDRFSENNLNRQQLCTESDLGRGKADVAGERIRALNGAVETRLVSEYLDESNVSACIGDAQLVIDALDNNGTRRIVSRYCGDAGLPFVHGAIGGLWAQAGIFRPGDRTPWDAVPDMPDRGVELSAGNLPFTAAFAASVETALAVEALTGIAAVESAVLHWFDLGDLSVQRISL